MFYIYLRTFARYLLWIVNGNAHYHHMERLLPKDENYILVSPHRTGWDPIYLAFSTRPKKFIYMAKKELFKNRAISWWIRMCGAFPIDRANPSPDTIKYPTKMLKKSSRSLIMFPSGSRHSDDVKGGVAVIAKAAKVKIMPVVYQGPMTVKNWFKRESVHLNFGNPIDVSDIRRMDAEGIQEVSNRIQTEFDRLDGELDQVAKTSKSQFWRTLIRIPFAIIGLIWLVLTIIGSYIASFIWNPEKHSL